MKTALLIIIFSLTLSPLYSQEQETKKCEVYIIRPSRFVGIAVKDRIIIGDTIVHKLKNNTTLKLTFYNEGNTCLILRGLGMANEDLVLPLRIKFDSTYYYHDNKSGGYYVLAYSISRGLSKLSRAEYDALIKEGTLKTDQLISIDINSTSFFNKCKIEKLY